MLFALIIGLFIFVVYKKTFNGVMYSSGFALTLVGLALVTTLVIMAVTSNVVLSLGMVGALSIVRFRAAIKEPIEIVYLFWSIATGIVIGAGMIPLAVIGSAIIGLILILFANRKVHENPYILMMAAAVAFCIWVTAFSQEAVEVSGNVKVPMEYETALFDTDKPIQIDIQMAQEQWEEMLENAIAAEYYACDVLINDQKLYNVGVRPKGNTSLSSIVSNPDTDRFSLKLEFDHYVEGQTCLGLDKLILNNNYADSTNMKEAVVYDMYQYLGADASLYNYAEISVNGTYLGVYLALEAVEESFLMRNYGTRDGELYKPDSMNMGGGSKGGGFGGQQPRPEEKGDAAGKERRQERGGGGPSMEGGNGGNSSQEYQ